MFPFSTLTTRSSLTEEHQASMSSTSMAAALVAYRMGNLAPLETQLALAKLQAEQSIIERANHQLALRAQLLSTRVVAASPHFESLSRIGFNQSLMVHPSLRSPTAAPAPVQAERAAASLVRSNSPQLSVPPSLASSANIMDTGKGTFPMKLHQMLSDLEQHPGGAEIASFLPHGKAFAIHKPREFVRHVMHKYFRMSHFTSFQRQLNLYEFQRITVGVDRGAYSHPMFVYGQPDVTASMKRNKIKGVKNKGKDLNNQTQNEEERSSSSGPGKDDSTSSSAPVNGSGDI